MSVEQFSVTYSKKKKRIKNLAEVLALWVFSRRIFLTVQGALRFAQGRIRTHGAARISKSEDLRNVSCGFLRLMKLFKRFGFMKWKSILIARESVQKKECHSLPIRHRSHVSAGVLASPHAQSLPRFFSFSPCPPTSLLAYSFYACAFLFCSMQTCFFHGKGSVHCFLSFLSINYYSTINCHWFYPFVVPVLIPHYSKRRGIHLAIVFLLFCHQNIDFKIIIFLWFVGFASCSCTFIFIFFPANCGYTSRFTWQQANTDDHPGIGSGKHVLKST